MPKSACTNGKATGIDHMPTLPMLLTATANPSRRHAAGVSTLLSWRSCKSTELPRRRIHDADLSWPAHVVNPARPHGYGTNRGPHIRDYFQKPKAFKMGRLTFASLHYVRFTPESGHRRVPPERPKCGAAKRRSRTRIITPRGNAHRRH